MKKPHIYSDQFRTQPDQVARLFNDVIDELNYKVFDDALLNATHPVGSVYMTTDTTAERVAELLGGEWERYGSSTTPYMFVRTN